jgi:homoserine kinase
MSKPAKVTISVPATTANLGPGFDCLGAALTLYNQFTFTLLETDAVPVTIQVKGEEADRVQTNASNLIYQSFGRFYQHLGQPVPSISIEIQLGVPLSRGLGSSATAIVGGLVGANALADFPLPRKAVTELAIALEGHPDNVVPALLGGCQLTAISTEARWEVCEIPWASTITPVVAIPDFELSTAAARGILPETYPRADVIFNAAHLGLLLRGLETGNPAWLEAALQDRVHQPYRKTLIKGYEAVHAAALAAGAYGLVISGAGPTLLALSDSGNAASVQTAIASVWSDAGIPAIVKPLQIDHQGATAQF